MAKKKQNIDLENERYGLFMSENSFNLDIAYGRNYMETDHHQTVTIYRVNVVKSQSHSLYGQTKSKDKKFFTPVKLNVMVSIESTQQSYLGGNSGGIVREDTGNLEFGVYLKELEEKSVEINRGDYIEYNMNGERPRYYEVENAENVTDTTEKTIGGFKSYWKKVTAVPIKEDVVPYLNETKGN